jgi:ribosomal protein S18 acetylase RimI-like enzyme
MQKIHVRQAGQGDLELLVPLFDQYRVFYQAASDPDSARVFLQERMQRSESVVLLAVEGEGEKQRAAGFTQLYPSFSSVTMQRLWVLNDLFVAAEFRGAGTGSLLLESAREYAQQAGSKGLTLTTWTDNTAAQYLYEKHGYVKDEEFYTYHLFFKRE